VEIGWRRLCSEEDGPGVGEAFLDRVDQQRYHEPAKALEVLQTVVGFASLDELPRLLAIAGAALRAQIHLAEAEHCYYAAIQGAQLRGDQRGVGNFLRWYSNLLLNQARLHDALNVADRAASLLLRENDTLGVAKACVEQGNCLFCLDRWEEALKAFAAGLARLPQEEELYRCAALQTSALAFKSLKKPEKALDYVQMAGEHIAALSPKHRAKLLWCHAGICCELGDWREEEALLWTVVDLLSETHHGEAALATCDLVRNLLVQERSIEAFEVATSMRSLVEPLRHNPIISAAIAELLRTGTEGLSLALIQKVRRKIENERKRRTSWQLLRAQL
jgi:tetratricopeptide (TPR) repeat protein